jgi:ABC-type transport system substrate-binding protein
VRVGRSAVVLLVAGLLGALVAGCVNEPVAPQPSQPTQSPPTPPAEPSKLVIGVDDLPGGFNPHLLANQDPVTTALANLVLPSVYRPDAAGVLRLDKTIATSAEVVADEPFTVSYELNLEASWSDNTPIAAEDFVYLWERMRSEPGVDDAAGYRLITDVRSRAGGKAVDVVFSHAYPAWQTLFTGLLPAHLLKDAPGSWIGATTDGLPASGGPFRIGTIDRARGLVELARNDLYWDTPAVLDTLVLQRLGDVEMAGGLASGDVDIALPTADGDIRTALSGLQPAPHTQLAPLPVVVQLGMRSDGGPLADPRARQGLAALLDRAAIRPRPPRTRWPPTRSASPRPSPATRPPRPGGRRRSRTRWRRGSCSRRQVGRAT